MAISAFGSSPPASAAAATRQASGLSSRPSPIWSQGRSSCPAPATAALGKSGHNPLWRRNKNNNINSSDSADDGKFGPHSGNHASMSKADELRLRRAQQQQTTPTFHHPSKPATATPATSSPASSPPPSSIPSDSSSSPTPSSPLPSSDDGPVVDAGPLPISFSNVSELRQFLEARKQATGQEASSVSSSGRPPPGMAASSSSCPPASMQRHPGHAAGAADALAGGAGGLGGGSPQEDADDDLDGAAAGAAEAPAQAAQAPFELDPVIEGSEDFQKAKRYAISLLQRAPLASADLARRLAARGHPPATCSQLVGWLGATGVLDDGLFARLYARSKWESGLAAPAKIRRDLAALGVAPEHVSSGLAAVFGPSRRIKLSGPATPQEKEVSQKLLEAARRHVEQRRGSYLRQQSSSSGGNSSSAGGQGAGGGARDKENWCTAHTAQIKDREANKRRLAMWLQYRGHDMGLITEVIKQLKM
ncbi:hypothetical protein Agub_g1514 [Astrephomene gubernaculifera]|uniref:Regulatory protein RecX n=1 Tax=Astrephomene gubernaculifera TaxID=47775 RepID=A0AAD3HHI6_9CHLO|nr:hypothetical protein Agub_g1514 [Astrephomene gubernaculifera]